MIVRLHYTALLVLMLLLGAMASAQASDIRAIVNNQPITRLDIDQHQRLMRLVNNGSSVSAQEALQQLIDQRLQLEAASRMNIRISDAQVNQRLDGIASGTPLKTRKAFLQGLQAQLGIYPRTIETFIRTQMAWGEVVRAVGARELQVRESEVDMFLREKGSSDSAETFTEYRIQQIIVVVPGNSSSGQKASLKRQAENVRTRFVSCEEMNRLRGTITGVVVKDLGWRNESAMSEEERKLFAGVAVNKTAPVRTTDAGYEVLAVCEKRSTDDNVAERVEAQNTLRQEKGGILADKLIRDLRANALIEYR